MHPSAAQPATAAILTENQRAALITLLADDDPVVYQAVREKILTCGQSARAWLRPHTLSRDPVLRRRAQEIIQHLARRATDDRFLAFCLEHHGEHFDLEQGIWLLAQTQYPDTNTEAYQALLDSYAAELRERIDPAARLKQTITVLNEFLFEQLGFRGDEKDYYDPDNSYLNRVMDRRLGNPISLSVIYLLVAQRLKLPIVGVGLPGHFLARGQDSVDEIYIDAFYRGRFLTRNDCIHHLVRGNYPLDETHFSAASSHRILTRMCANLHQSYRRMQLADEAARLKRYVVALAR
jgi:regulator of sirC expression with transglutaminase-like and TPR domain